MRKEVLIAIISGIVFGLFLAFGIWRANNALKNTDPSSTAKVEATETKDGISSNSDITIARPENDDVILHNPVVITGITKPDTTLLISTENMDLIVNTADDGSFEKEVELEPSENIIRFNLVSENSLTEDRFITLVFSSELSKHIETNTTQENNKGINEDETDPIRLKAQEKLQSASNKPKAFLGIVTDIAQNSFQIKNSDGQIQQTAVDTNDLTVAKINSTTQNLKYSDLAIGDYVIAMGLIDETEVLNAKRILVSEPATPPSYHAIIGDVTEITGRKVELNTFDGTSYTLSFPRKWNGPEISELEPGMKLLAVGKDVSGNFEIRTISIISPSNNDSE